MYICGGESSPEPSRCFLRPGRSPRRSKLHGSSSTETRRRSLRDGRLTRRSAGRCEAVAWGAMLDTMPVVCASP